MTSTNPPRVGALAELTHEDLRSIFASVPDAMAVVHANNLQKGWWEGERKLGELLMLVVTELTEARAEAMAFSHLPRNEPLLYAWEGEGGKPEGFRYELADAGIRVLDIGAGKGYRLTPAAWGVVTAPWFNHPDLNGGLLDLVDRLSLALEAYRKGTDEDVGHHLTAFLDTLATYASAWGIDLYDAMAVKHAYNVTRPYRHGGTRA